MNLSPRKKLQALLPILLLLCIISCASYGVSEGKNIQKYPSSGEPSFQDFSVFLVGDTQNFDLKEGQKTHSLLKRQLDSAGQNSFLLFLGNTASALPSDSLQTDIPSFQNLIENFKGKTLIIPGNEDWKNGLEGLKNQERTFKNILKTKDAFLPKDGCALDKIKVNDRLVLITVNSEWILANWDHFPGINKNCDLQTRDDFYAELRSMLIKYQNQTVILAMHHPILNTGTHAGYTSAKMQLYPGTSKIPLPVLGSVYRVLSSASGSSSQDLNNQRYADFSRRIQNILQEMNHVIVVSGHDHNLQYHASGNIRQIISGSANRNAPATITENTDFSYGGNGFAVLHLRNNESQDVEFFSTEATEPLLLSHIEIRTAETPNIATYPKEFPDTFTASVYPKELTQKGALYRTLWGNHYRKYYSIDVKVPVANLTHLYGGLVPFRTGGGNQSNTLRLRAANGQEFTMRAVRKDAVRFLNKVAFKTDRFGDELSGTFPDRFLTDFYTTVHPYTPFVVNRLIDNIGLLHSNPHLFYIPKQTALGKYNTDYGDALYMIEERFSDDPETLKQLGNADEILSTDELILKLHKNTDAQVDMPEYVRARLFDMLTGDWDRHDDQWKWAGYKQDGKIRYRPIPRDRDQAFSTFDGWLIRLIMTTPDLRHMKSYGEKIRNIKWMNREPYPIDLIFARTSTEKDWLEQAEYIQKNLTEEEIQKAFSALPKEIQDDTVKKIIRDLLQRKSDLKTYAAAYYQVLQKTVPLAGTDKKDRFVVTQAHNESRVEIFKKNASEPWFSKSYQKKTTDALWLFGLNDDDIFEVKGTGTSRIKLILAGGYQHDTYQIENGKKVKIYDFRSQNNTYETVPAARKIISDRYNNNMYNFRKPMYSYGTLYPDVAYNPDDGVAVGLTYSYVVNRYIRNPFTAKHDFNARYFSATGGFSLNYHGLMKEAVSDWDLGIQAQYTTPFFTQNFFGLSNESPYFREEVEKKYNRARLREIRFSPSLSKTLWNHVEHQLQLDFQSMKVEKTEGRYISEAPEISEAIFRSKEFVGATYAFSYLNKDHPVFPQLGMELNATANWKTSLNHENQNFLTLTGHLKIDHRIDKNGRFVLANALSAAWINNRNFEFYQAANIGGDNGLRAYRTQRFSGKSFVLNSSEIRWNLGQLRNSFLPASYGVALGYDVGRVWNPGERSTKWHQSAGASVWLTMLNKISLRMNGFSGEDGFRLSFGLGMSF